jgi:hypothetical protein
MQWLENLGYDNDLFSIRSRNFVLSVHSNNPLDFTLRDAVQTDLDNRANVLISHKFGYVTKTTETYDVYYTFSEQVMAYSYCVRNRGKVPIEFTIDNKNSVNMI